TYVENVVEANLLAASCRDGVGSAMNIACGERYSLRDLLERLERIVGRKAEPEFRPPRKGDVLHSQGSIEKARSTLGFEPKVGFEEGLRRTVEHFRHGR